MGETAMRLTGSPAGSAEQIAISLSTRDLAAAGGRGMGLTLFSLGGAGTWIREDTQTLDAASGRLTFRPSRAGTYVVLARSLFPAAGDYAIQGGHFFRAVAGDAGGAGAPGGYSVVDGVGGARAAFWTVYGAVGGEAVLGRPVSRRYVQDGRLVQAFERGVITAEARSNATARHGATAQVPDAAREPEAPPPALPVP
jgi:hypothetical protein